MNNSRPVVVICLVLAAHVAVDLLLLVGDWEIRGDWDLFLLAWPFSQASLIAIWAAISRIRSYLKFPAALLGVCGTWFLVADLLEGPRPGPTSAGWAVLLATQAVSILILITAGYLIWRQIRRRRSGGRGNDLRPMQFSLKFLFLWTTLLAVGLGLGRMAFAHLGWTSEVVHIPYFWYYPVLGACDAACALVVFASLAGPKWLVIRILLAAALVGALGHAHWYLFMLLFGDTGGIRKEGFVMLAACQAAYLCATLLSLRWCGCFGTPAAGNEPRQSGSTFAPSAGASTADGATRSMDSRASG